MLGDSGGNELSQQAVADKLNQEWTGTDAWVPHVSDYYDVAAKGGHADLRDTSELLAVFPRGVRSGMIGKVGTNGGATGSIDTLLNSVLQALGIGLGQVDTWVTGVRCDGAVLVN